ncbi:LOW QUALITY PROTEIN: centrosomal protein of 192 kDa [Bufo gargarizans]|uniref:LOW QUALITY PROTEIN: centrosomal protein of 192 kDa n=1 Tax=Bufo gargarizans TaxID=30331 RepID=UPI001CF0F747|nr:LOW QUALITY PROTEIN: centrosomal protein of 192 kDa [Bufo gargarizans]
MTEHYKNIEDETFPSYLADSINSNLSEALENCTLSSTLGLPVAASTVAKVRPASDRSLDVQASYLENEKLLLPTSGASSISHSGGKAKEKFVLTFKDDLGDLNAFIEASNIKTQKAEVTDHKLQEEPLYSQRNDFLHDLLSQNKKDTVFTGSSLFKGTEREKQRLPDVELRSSAASFLEDEKLVSIASLDGSSSDELDDEIFDDEQLEAYFKRLMPPGMQRGAIEGQEIQDTKRSSYMARNSLPSIKINPKPERSKRFENYEEDFQMPNVRLAATGMDSTPASDDDNDVEHELERAAQLHLQREHFMGNTNAPLADEQHRPSFRPGLEGGSSEEESSNEMQSVSNGMSACRQSAEGYGVCSPGAFPLGAETGDGSGKMVDGPNTSQTSELVLCDLWKKDMATRNIAGEEDSKQASGDRIGPVGNGGTSKEANGLEKSQQYFDWDKQSSWNPNSSLASTTQKLDSHYFKDGRASNGNFGLETSTDLSQMFSHTTHTSGFVDTASLDTAGKGNVNRLADTYLSPTCSNQTGYDIWQSGEMQTSQWSFQQSNDKGFQSQSVVYQNEEGKWVTDLAYYKPFEKKSLSGSASDFKDENFIVGGDALAMLDEDQEEFEKENKFIQEEKMDLENDSVNLGDTSWKVPVNGHVLLKASQTSDLSQEEASYLRLSLGEFFGQRSEAMGCLGGGTDIKRPSFGYYIISPEKHQPIVLLRNSIISEDSDDTLKLCDNTLTQEDLGCLADDQKLSSTTFDVRMPESKRDIDALGKEEYKGSAERQLFGSFKPDQTTETTMLSMSTIASALANASCSADPSEFAAMIMALSNKNKEKMLHESVGHQQSKQLLNLSGQNAGNFDMERYLKATIKNDQENDLESFMQSVKDFTWDLSLGYKQPLQDSAVELANITDVQKQDLRKPEFDVQVGCDTLQSANSASSCNLSTQNSRLSEIPEIKRSASRNSVPSPNQEHETQNKRSSAIAPLNRSPSEDEAKRGKNSHKESNSLKSCILSSPKKTGSPLSNDPNSAPCSKETYNVRNGHSQKHVSFQPPSSGIHPKMSDCVHTVEEEQYSFRPSTSPLIHSSPSQDSIKLSEKGSINSPQELASAQRHSDAGLSPESSCLSASLSRLTYVSAIENTTIQSPDDQKSNNTIELSTTIVRASPTPSEMQMIQSNALPWQENKCPKYTETPKVSRSPTGFRTLSAYNGGSKTEADGKRTEPGYPAINYNVKALGSDLKCFETQSDGASEWQRYASKQTQGLSSGNMLQSALLEKYNSLQNIPGSRQCVCAQGFKPVLPPSDLQKLPSSDPRLLNAPSLSTTPQQYLSGVPSMPYFTFGSHAGYPGCALHDPLTANVASGILSTLPMGNHASGSQSSSHHIHMVDSQAGPAGFSQWATRTSSGFGQVLVPEEVTFPNMCCVGIASQASLNVFNSNERWMQVNIGIISIAVNGEKIDVGANHCLIFKNKTIIGPRASEDVKVLLLPQRAGLFQCVLSVSSWPVSADAETIVRAETMSSKVLLTAVSEYPLIEVDTGKTDCLDFGDLTSGSWKNLPLRLINKTRATVPIRLIISANATAWRCFTFSKNPAVKEFGVHMDSVSKMSSPSVISHVMYASYENQEPEALEIWVVFHAPQTYNSAACSLEPPEEFIARVDIEVDSPGPACLLKSIPLHARVGCAKIHAPKDLQTIHLRCDVGSSTKQQLPLKNAGNIAAHLRVKCTTADSIFTVDPEELFIGPEEEQVVVVKFSPRCTKVKQSSLKIIVQPSGPQYEVPLIGESELSVTKNSANLTLQKNSDEPPILSNKQFISWGGVAVGRAVQQKLTLRNPSTISSQHLRLLIRGQDQDCFQLQSSFGPEERLTNNRELTIRPKEDSSVLLMFSPTHVGCMLAKLEIKQSGIKSSQPGIKFTIPLSGYGGTSNVILEGVKKLSDSYMITLSGVMPDRVSRGKISIRNTGSRAAYVKAVCFANVQKGLLMDSSSCSVTPEKFILKEGTQEMVTITYNGADLEEGLQSSTPLLCTVCFFCGDEVSRQQFRRSLQYKPESVQKYMAENTKLKNVRFDEEFRGEHLVSEVYDLPQRPNDVQHFYGAMHKVTLSVFGSASEENNGASLQPCLNINLASPSNTSLDVLPVKGPQGPLLPNSVSSQNTIPEQRSWTVQPEVLVLRAPTVGGLAATGHIKIVNNAPKSLQFDVSWPAHCLTISPQQGNVEPRGHTVIVVSPNPLLSTKQIMLPWNGQIYVQSDIGQKIVKVQITSEGFSVMSPNGVPKSSFLLPSSLETPVHAAKPLSKSPSSKIELRNRTVVFPRTVAGGSSETLLDIENPSDEDIKWLLSSFAPPYVKALDESGDVYRATYTAFRCARVSGVLAADEKLKVPVTFFPRDKGDYTQCWDLECHPVSKPHLKYKVRFQLCGEGFKDEREFAKSSSEALEVQARPRQRSGSEASALKPVQEEAVRGVFASEDFYTFPSTLVGESSTLKVNLRNNSFTTYLLRFVSPKEPFHMKHSKYSLRAHHYINLPVKFKPTSAGRFECHLVVQSDAGDISIPLVGEALMK